MLQKVLNFRKEILSEFNFSEYELFLLDAVCENLDLFFRANKDIKKFGTVVKTKNGIKQNPATQTAKNAWNATLSGLRALGIKNTEVIPDYTGKPGRKRKD